MSQDDNVYLFAGGVIGLCESHDINLLTDAELISKIKDRIKTMKGDSDSWTGK